MRPVPSGDDGGGRSREPRDGSGHPAAAGGGTSGRRSRARRKAYRTPRLIIYGDLRAITGIKGSGGADGGSLNSKLF